MKICILQHVPFEGAGTILPFFQGQSAESGRSQDSEHQIQMIHCYQEHQLPRAEEFDLLIVMGGPMSIQDIEEYPYLVGVKALIRAAIDEKKWVLGVCLGAQLVAEALGANVRKNHVKEIGWYPVQQTQQASTSWLADLLPCEFTCLHWHGDTFDIPAGAVHIARSQACENQAFVWGGRVIGLQFHLEFTPDSTQNLIDRSQHELAERQDGADGRSGDWIQTEQQLLDDQSMFDTANHIMAGLLKHIESEIVFELHPQLAKNCHHLADFACSRVLLHKNAEIPWFILVPRGQYRDLDEMQKLTRHRLLEESDQIADLLRQEFGAEKINVAALGNMVPQLHLHVIGRRADDCCWPNPVWGHLNTESHWSADKLEHLKQRLDLLNCD